MTTDQRIGEAIGELRAFAAELRTVPPECRREVARSIGTLKRLQYRKEMRMAEMICDAIADRIDEIRERMESGNR